MPVLCDSNMDSEIFAFNLSADIVNVIHLDNFSLVRDICNYNSSYRRDTVATFVEVTTVRFSNSPFWSRMSAFPFKRTKMRRWKMLWYDLLWVVLPPK